jgi:hypothetical protein
MQGVNTFVNNDKLLVIIGLILIVCFFVVSYNLYVTSNHDINGVGLTYIDTIKNIFGLLHKAGDIVVDSVDPLSALKNINDHHHDIPHGHGPGAVDVIYDEDMESHEYTNGGHGNGKSCKKKGDKCDWDPDGEIEKNRENPKKCGKKKEVFNIDRNEFTYEEAGLVCKALGCELATYDQIKEAHKNGAHWCNYGWSANQMALFPIQQAQWNKLQKGGPETQKMCGKPGINGGYFSNKSLRFGVNCYGYKPKPDPGKIVYSSDGSTVTSEIAGENDGTGELDTRLDKYRQMLSEGNLDARPFNADKWSRYSFKKSSYIINPTHNKNDLEVVTTTVADDDKNPQKYIDIIKSIKESNSEMYLGETAGDDENVL